MNEISSTLKDEIKKSKEKNYKEKFKLFFTIIITNIFVFFFFAKKENINKPAVINLKKIHNAYKMMVFPAVSLVGDLKDKENENPVTLMSKDKKIIASKAFLHEISSRSDKGEQQFKIEISEEDVIKISDAIETGVIIVPYMNQKKNNIPATKGSKYEISL